MQLGAGSGESYVPVFCMQDASPSKSEKSLILDIQGNFGFPSVAEEMSRLFGPGCGAARQDASVATAVGMSSGEEGDFAIWVAHRDGKKKRGYMSGRLATQKSKNNIKGD